MRLLNYLPAILFLILSSCSEKKDSYVVMLSLDGFRWDYTTLAETPNFDRIAEEGVKATSLIPAYPTKTFPNHYSMATGLYPDHHGIVQNNFYDPDLDRAFRLGNRDAVQDSVFWNGEPIWETAEKQGVRAASYYWVGSETNALYQPSIRKLYDQSVPFKNRADSVIQWLHLPKDKRPRLILFYYHEPDGIGHDFGPDSPEIVQTVAELDGYLGYFLDQLEATERELGIEIDFIVTSDHGMGGIPQENNIILGEILDLERFDRIYGGNPVYMMTPQKDYFKEAVSILGTQPNLKVYRKNALPEHYHYGQNNRIEDLIIEANAGYGLSLRSKVSGYSAGTHGYDPRNTDMHGIFYARGPAFKSGFVSESFENVCLYPLIAEILRLTPAATDGKLDDVADMLVDEGSLVKK